MARLNSRIACALLKELFETCAFAATKLRGVPSWGPTARLAVESLVLLRPDDHQQILNCKVNSCARSQFLNILQCAPKQRASIGASELAAGLQGCCTLCWPAQGTPRRDLQSAKRAHSLASLAGAGARLSHLCKKKPRRAHAVAARTRPTQTTQIIASSASRCRAFANRVALRRQK